ncbi:hypothetical protein CEP88_11860 [Roseobacter denitrificans]|uniref:Uncharacterized protein n=1 Tax=Roseobacter denitrificans (strain ATCC 33942 / OCh 114) TaxID=375451 RepID=Q16DB0_ROSDO|nr:hypothetical protein [Roseobacter denitrificans]ABG30033.1 hypothetical protein RD1_0309 [Roseobacter denitrificans OCh 114]AVL53234.1 hypothetical protein CEP88_11860 [Roseobacter denitrificans]SFF68920.1 hypothetical protein SAMN05443635_10141 [Roseobacter denitrificans OCh 114]
MTKHAITLQLSDDLFKAVHDLATEQQGTVAEVVEDLVTEHLGGPKSAARRLPRAGEKLIFALQKLLFRDMAEARDWADLDDRLRKHGYFMKITLGGLALHTETSGKRVCHTHDLGFSYGTFVRRFGPGKPKDPREL